MSLVQTLYRLQQVDSEWDEKAASFQDVRRALSDLTLLEEARSEQVAREKALSVTRARLRDLELELQTLQRKAKQIEDDLYSGRINSPRELEGLAQDRQYTLKHISDTEDGVLLALTEVEELESAQEMGQEALASFEARWAEERAILSDAYRELHARLLVLKESREALRGALTRSSLALYDELRVSKGGVALAPAQEGRCQTCHVSIPSVKWRLVESGEQVISCEGCGRILYVG